MRIYLRKNRYNMPAEGYEEKICPHCSVTFIPKTKTQKFCCTAHGSQYRAKHIYDYKYNKAFRSRSPRHFMGNLMSYKERHKTLSLDFLCDLYTTQQGRCAVSGVEMTYEQGKGKLRTNISIDRIDSKRGYEKDNVRLVCTMVNKMRQDMNDEDFLSWCKLVLTNNS